MKPPGLSWQHYSIRGFVAGAVAKVRPRACAEKASTEQFYCIGQKYRANRRIGPLSITRLVNVFGWPDLPLRSVWNARGARLDQILQPATTGGNPAAAWRYAVTGRALQRDPTFWVVRWAWLAGCAQNFACHIIFEAHG